MTVYRVEHVVCAYCHTDRMVERHTKGGRQRRFCSDDCCRRYQNERRIERSRESAARFCRCTRCGGPTRSRIPVLCFKCRRLRGGNAGRPEDADAVPENFAAKLRAYDQAIAPHALPDLSCPSCTAEGEVIGFYDARILETVPWLVCRRGHYTKVERRRIA